MKASKEEIIHAIISSNILDEYFLVNPELRGLLKNWRNPNVYFGKEFIPTIQQKQIYARRMKMSLDHAAEYQNNLLNGNGLKDVLAFIESHPSSKIFTMIFNCTTESFDIWCSELEDTIQIICVLKGGHIPDYAFKTS